MAKASQAFDSLKSALACAALLVLPDFDILFEVECDACGQGLGAVLMQSRRPIAYFSRALHGRHLLLSTYKKEMLALVMAVQKWRHYLMGRTSVVHTDHSTLKLLWDQ